MYLDKMLKERIKEFAVDTLVPVFVGAVIGFLGFGLPWLNLQKILNEPLPIQADPFYADLTV